MNSANTFLEKDSPISEKERVRKREGVRKREREEK